MEHGVRIRELDGEKKGCRFDRWRFLKSIAAGAAAILLSGSKMPGNGKSANIRLPDLDGK